MLEALQALVEDTEWDVHPLGDLFICPCGDYVELDGTCPEGHVSPLLQAGLI